MPVTGFSYSRLSNHVTSSTSSVTLWRVLIHNDRVELRVLHDKVWMEVNYLLVNAKMVVKTNDDHEDLYRN